MTIRTVISILLCHFVNTVAWNLSVRGMYQNPSLLSKYCYMVSQRPTYLYSKSAGGTGSLGDPSNRSAASVAVIAHYRTEKGSSGRLPRAVSMFDVTVSSLIQYKQIYGNIDVSLDYTIPMTLPWDQKAWGLKLGRLCNTMRRSNYIKSFPKTRETLDEIGFAWTKVVDPRGIQSKLTGFEKSITATETIKSEVATVVAAAHTHFQTNRYLSNMIVSNNSRTMTASISVDPGDDSRPYDRFSGGRQQVTDSKEQQRKMYAASGRFSKKGVDNIDKLARSIRDVSTSADGFDFSRSSSSSTSREQRAEVVLDSAFETVYLESAAPERHKAYYEGYMSPFEVGAILAAPIGQHKMQEMLSIGHRIVEFGRYNWTTVLEALTLFQKSHGDLLVHKDFVVTMDTLPLVQSSTHLLGMPLGKFIEAIRTGDVDAFEDPVRKLELDKLNFQWGDMSTHLRFRFSPMLQGLKIYSALFDMALTPSNFIVPSGDPTWPVWMHDMPLGLWCDVARVQQEIIKYHYPDRYEMLNAVDFVWWVEPGQYLPAKYFTPISSV